LTACSLNSAVYSCFGIFIVFPSKSDCDFTSPLEDEISGEAHMSSLDLAGRVVCSSGPENRAESFGQTDWFKTAVGQDRLAVGRPAIGPATGRWTCTLAYPVHDREGRLVGVIALSMDLADYLPTLGSATLPPGTVYGIVDGNGTVVARFPSSRQWVGRNLLGTPMVDAVLRHREGQAVVMGADGVERMYGFTTVRGVDWHASAGIPSSYIYAETRAQAIHNGLFALAIVLAIIAVAWLLSRRITGPIRRIAGVAKAIAEGRLDTRAPVEGSAEIAEVARQFNKMCDIRKQAGEALKNTSERCQWLSHRLLEIQETERRNLARELHDEIGQALTAVKIHLQAAQRSVTAKASPHHFDECVRIVERALQQVRNLSLNLRPPLLDDLGLPAALRWQLDAQGRAAGLTAQFTSNALTDRLHPDLETICFRVAQEALTNAVRHAQAKKVSVELRQLENEVHLSIKDDGKGFDVQAARARALKGRSMGLLSMEERVMLAGGRLELDSAPNRGTRVHAVLPLTFAAQASEAGGSACGGVIS
jgi:signal transduction histidine kinase